MSSCSGQYTGADLRDLRIGFTGGANVVLLASVAAKARLPSLVSICDPSLDRGCEYPWSPFRCSEESKRNLIKSGKARHRNEIDIQAEE